MKYSLMNLQTIQIPIEIIDAHFFIKWDTNDKRYRISASFKYLNNKYGLHINIIRDLKKTVKIGTASFNLKFLLSLINNHSNVVVDDSLNYKQYTDLEKETSFFYVSRIFQGEINYVLVFFSLKYWDINDYLISMDTQKINKDI